MSSYTKIGLLFGWWNTSLSPLGKSRADTRSKEIAAVVVKSLIDVEGVDCLALGEVTRADLQSFAESCESGPYDFFGATAPMGRLSFDIGIIYNTERLHIHCQPRSVESQYGNSKLKVALRIDFTIIDTNEPLHVFVSHWPSRTWCPEHSTKRDTLGMRLRNAVNEIKKDYPYPPQVILIGDYNDEPFNRSLSGHLLASRDRDFAKKYDGLFYNPFWRLLGESLPHSNKMLAKSFAGTYFHKRGNETTHWRTFDQIMVSSSFLKNERWYLNEEYVRIWQSHPLESLIDKTDEIFDHFPVVALIQRKLGQGPGGDQND